MASTLTFTCPECGKDLKGPAELKGKTIRCKACGESFVVKPTPAAKTAAGSRTSKPKPKPPAPAKDDDEYGEATPYGVTTEKLGTRCPHCAAEMESDDAVVCVECGYNTVTRQQMGTKRVAETTGGDVMLWLLPGILSLVGIFLLLISDVLLIFLVGLLPEGRLWGQLKLGIVIWGIIASLFGIYLLARFAIKRLIMNPTPPEE